MDSTLTIHIPFFLLGRRAVCDPDSPPSSSLRSCNRKISSKSNTRSNSNSSNASALAIQIVHRAFEALCPDIRVHVPLLPPVVVPPSTSPQQQQQQQQHTTTSPTKQKGWTLHTLPNLLSLSPPEAAKLDPKTWIAGLALTYTGLPIDTPEVQYTGFERETRALLSALREFADRKENLSEAGVDGPVRWWDVLCAVRCGVRIDVVPGSLRGEVQEGEGVLEPGMVKGVYVVAAAVERLFIYLSLPRGLLGFWGIGRVLEDELRKKVWEKVGGLNGNGSGKSTRGAWKDQEERYLRKKEYDEERFEKVIGRKKECWDCIDELDERGWEALVRNMRLFRNRGRRMGVECLFLGDADGDGERIGRITFQGLQNSCDAEEVLAYTDLVANIARMAANGAPHARLALLGEETSTPRNIVQSCAKVLDVLHVRPHTRRFVLNYFRTTYSSNNKDTTSASAQDLIDSRCDPFQCLRDYVCHEKEKERSHMPDFVARYEEAGGFRPTPVRKVFRMIDAGKKKEVRKERVLDRSKVVQWLERVEIDHGKRQDVSQNGEAGEESD